MPDDAKPSLSDLLEHSPWLRKLALGLVRDESRAEDVVQQAYLAVVERPPSDLHSPGGWLRRVVHNLAARTHREDSRRRAREERVARPEGVYAAEALVERAELQRRVAEAVVELDEPYRSAILLHYYEELTPHEIALELDVPVATVWTRISRAKERLRKKLDGEYGSRAAWCAPLIPFLTDPTLAATGSLGANSAAGAPSTATASVETLLTAKAALTMVACTVSFFVGFGAMQFAGFSDPGPGNELTQDMSRENSDLRSRASTLQGIRDGLRDEQRHLMRSHDELAARMTSLERELALALQPDPITGAGLPLAYGKFAELELLEQADWMGMAEAILAMNAHFLAMEDRWARSEEIPLEEKLDIAKINMALVPFALNLIGHISTSVRNGNGEFTHPVVVTNLSAQMLELAGAPLDESQAQQLIDLGLDYESRWDLLTASYDEGVPALEKVLDEVELKNEFMDGLRNTLTPDQNWILAPSGEMEDIMGFDALSPVIVFAESRSVRPVRSRESVPEVLRSRFAEVFEISENDLAGLSHVFESWARDLDPYLEWYGGLSCDGLPMEIALGTGRAQVNAFRALERVLSSKDRERLWSSRFIMLLRLR